MMPQTDLETLHEIVNRGEYQTIFDDLKALRPAFLDEPLFAHLDGLVQIMPRLKESVRLPQPFVPAPTPEPDAA